MPQKTNLNISPYYDDFSKDKQFYKVLFRPGYPVQARELTTLQSTLQNQGASSDYYAGVIQCNVYCPKGKGTSVLSEISEAVIDGLTSVNASGYTDTFSCKPRVLDITGPTPLDIEDRSHFVGVISCQFTANA